MHSGEWRGHDGRSWRTVRTLCGNTHILGLYDCIATNTTENQGKEIELVAVVEAVI